MIHLFSKRTDSSGFSDEELRAAAQAVRNSMLQSLEEAAEPHHTFSESFLRRMQELLRLDQRRNSRRRILQRAAVFLLGVFISGALFLAFNSEARAEFTRWVRQIYEKSIYNQFYPADPRNVDSSYEVLPEVSFGWLPDTYTITEILNKNNHIILFLENEKDSLFLEYWLPDSIDYVEFLTEKYAHENVIVYGNHADYYRSLLSGVNNVLIWTNKNEQIVFYLFSSLGKNTMINIAEGIKEK